MRWTAALLEFRAAEVISGPYREVLIDGAGHWLQQERPGEVDRGSTVRVQTKTGTIVEFSPVDVVALRVLTDAPVRTR